MSIIPITAQRGRRGRGRGGEDGHAFSLEEEMWDTFNSFRDDVFSSFRPFYPFSLGRSRGRIDWEETPDAHFFSGYFPGMRLDDDVVVEVGGEDRVLNIRAGNFSTTFQLPENARLDLVTADMLGGHLTVTIPKDVSVEEWNRLPNNNIRLVEIDGGSE